MDQPILIYMIEKLNEPSFGCYKSILAGKSMKKTTSLDRWEEHFFLIFFQWILTRLKIRGGDKKTWVENWCQKRMSCYCLMSCILKDLKKFLMQITKHSATKISQFYFKKNSFIHLFWKTCRYRLILSYY